MKRPFGPYSTHVLNISPERAPRQRWSIPLSFEVAILVLMMATCLGMGAGTLIGHIVDTVRKTGGW